LYKSKLIVFNIVPVVTESSIVQLNVTLFELISSAVNDVTSILFEGVVKSIVCSKSPLKVCSIIVDELSYSVIIIGVNVALNSKLNDDAVFSFKVVGTSKSKIGFV
jgi:hypothetical protein